MCKRKVEVKILYLPNSYSQQRQFEKKNVHIYPVLMAMECEYYRQRNHEVYWGVDLKTPLIGTWDKVIEEPDGLPFFKLPHPDRTFTRWQDYQENGNFKYLPATYIMSANGCWHGKCSFCVEQNKKWEVRPIDDVIEEIDKCQIMGFKEIFDDSGTFPTGKWLYRFCKKMVVRNAFISCNMRMVDVNYGAMKMGRFRMLLFGLESASQYTLDRINKGVKVEDYKYIIKASKAGLEPHVAVMFGFPWETDRDAENTLRLVWWLLQKGYAKTAQASWYQPDKSTSGYCQANSAHKRYIKRIYEVSRYPEFWFRKLRDIRNIYDLKYFWKSIKTGLKECRQ